MYQYATKSMFLVIVLLTSCLLGCRDAPTSVVAEFEPNMVYAYKQAQEYELAMDGALEQTTAALEEAFGTPDDPKIPAIVLDDPELSSIVSMEHLTAASGPAEAPGRGLYRKHCALCHGVTGNGRGTSAAILPVYPRDYRLGRFKFKSTPRGVKPTKANIAYLIKHGIAGTSMVKIVPELSDEEIAALVDYVVYLSWRGKVERDLLFEAADSEEPDSIYNVALKTSEDEEERELFQDNLDLLEEFVVDAAESWLDMEERALELPQRDPAVVPDTVDEVLSAMASDEPSPIKESVARGMALFTIDKAACFKCHGKQGRGDGENNDYDDWAKDWGEGRGNGQARTPCPLHCPRCTARS